jgi:hypothetical protein
MRDVVNSFAWQRITRGEVAFPAVRSLLARKACQHTFFMLFSWGTKRKVLSARGGFAYITESRA